MNHQKSKQVTESHTHSLSALSGPDKVHHVPLPPRHLEDASLLKEVRDTALRDVQGPGPPKSEGALVLFSERADITNPAALGPLLAAWGLCAGNTRRSG